MIINPIDKLIAYVNDKQKQRELFSRIKSKEYIVFLGFKVERLRANVESIYILNDHQIIEDAYTILRKFIETYMFIMINVKKPELITKYLYHNQMLTLKIINKKIYQVKEFTKGKPDGFLEYGFVESLVDSTQQGFKYTMHTIAKIAEQEKYYRWYKICSNFVHNNLNNLKVNKPNLSKKILIMVAELSTNLLTLFGIDKIDELEAKDM